MFDALDEEHALRVRAERKADRAVVATQPEPRKTVRAVGRFR